MDNGKQPVPVKPAEPGRKRGDSARKARSENARARSANGTGKAARGGGRKPSAGELIRQEVLAAHGKGDSLERPTRERILGKARQRFPQHKLSLQNVNWYIWRLRKEGSLPPVQ